jgi:hypothetical protein
MQSVLARRVASGAVVALAAATLSLGAAGTANAITTIDLEGTVHGVGGALVEDACVEAFDAADDSYLGESCTGAEGHYSFDDLAGATSVKLFVYDDSAFAFTGDTQYLGRWFGGSKFQELATPINGVTADGDKVQDVTMTPAAVISGSVAAGDGHQLTGDWNIDVFDGDFNWSDYNDVWDGINFKLALEPGTYRVGASGYDNPPYISYLEKWWKDGDSVVSGTPIVVASGQTAAGIDIRLMDKLTARQAPSVVGIPAVGRPLTAKPGTWTRNAGTEFTYTWKRGATVVGTGATYTPTAADFGQQLNVVVRALNGDNAGEAASAQTDVVRYPADAKGKAKALAGKKVRFGVKIVSAKQSPVKGKVVVMRGTKKVHKAVKLVHGKAVIVVKHQPKGKQTYTVMYKGNSVLSIATKTFTVRVH